MSIKVVSKFMPNFDQCKYVPNFAYKNVYFNINAVIARHPSCTVNKNPYIV